MELRGRERIGAIVVRHDDQRARWSARVRAGDRWYRRGERSARRAGEEYLLERSLFRRKSTGEVAKPAYLEFAFPYYWHYDVLRALDYFRGAGAEPDPRMAEAVERGALEAPGRRPLAARPHPCRPRPLRRRRGRRHAEPLEHAAGAPGARVVGRHLTARASSFAFTLALRIFLIAAAGTFWSNLIWNVSLRTL